LGSPPLARFEADTRALRSPLPMPSSPVRRASLHDRWRRPRLFDAHSFDAILGAQCSIGIRGDMGACVDARPS